MSLAVQRDTASERVGALLSVGRSVKGLCNVKRANFFVDDKRLRALKHVATTERVSIAELVREGIDRVIRDRIKNPRSERAQLQADLEAYLQKYADKGQARTDEEIDQIVTEARGKRIRT